jgi:hypothetical protein
MTARSARGCARGFRIVGATALALAFVLTSSHAFAQECRCSDLHNPVCASIETDAGLEEHTFLNECVATECGNASEARAGVCSPGDEINSGDSACVCGFEDSDGLDFGCAACFSTPQANASRGWPSLGLLGAAVLGLFVRRKR